MKQPKIKVRNSSVALDIENPNNWTSAADVLNTIYLNRGISDQNQLNYKLSSLPSPGLLKSNFDAAELLADEIKRQARLLIVADFDVDGATSCALMFLALKAMGAENVDYLVPDRFKYGYGLTPEIVEVAAELNPDLIITVDNGIASVEGVKRANDLGMKVLITDHHLPGKILPDAIAIVNPNQKGCEFPSKNLAGVGVAFYLMMSLRMQLRTDDWFKTRGIEEPNLSQFLDLVALGTVADIVPLDHCNRILVQQGLARIRAGFCRKGIKALLVKGNKEYGRVQSSDLGFAVGPRLNAAGRLDDMSLGIECLLAETDSKAEQLATELDRLNRERREIESTMQLQALKALDKLSLDDLSTVKQTSEKKKQNTFGLCLYKEDWHQGIIGLLASRIKDKVYRPVIVFAEADNGLIKGSGRSVTGIHIKDVLDVIATENPDLLSKFGGHAMAAGMTIKKTDFQRFNLIFDQAVENAAADITLDNIIWSDGNLPHRDITLNLAQMLQQAGPWGQAFEQPCFHGDFRVISQRVLSGKHLKLDLENSYGKNFSAIAFFQEDSLLESHLNQVRIVYKVDVNHFRGQENLQLMIETIFPV